jgi:hypothetical protein
MIVSRVSKRRPPPCRTVATREAFSFLVQPTARVR